MSGRPRMLRLSHWLRERFGERVFKVSLQGGFDCPNRDGTLGRGGCAFCAEDALLPSDQQPGASLPRQLDAGVAYVEKRHGARRFIAYFQDHSATYGATERLARLYETALADPRVVGLAVGTRPDCLPPPVVDLLAGIASRKLLWLELGLQIAEDRLLAALDRHHSVADFVDAARRCQQRGISICAHVIIGLPGATAADEARTARLLSDLGVWGVKLHAFHVLRGTRMEALHNEAGLPLLGREEHAERVVDFIERLPADVVIHRVTGEAARRLTVAPLWTVNKMAAYDAVLAVLERRDSWQGKKRSRPSLARPADR